MVVEEVLLIDPDDPNLCQYVLKTTEPMWRFCQSSRKQTEDEKHPTQITIVHRRRLTESSLKQDPPCALNCQNTGLVCLQDQFLASHWQLIWLPGGLLNPANPFSPGSSHPSQSQCNTFPLLFQLPAPSQSFTPPSASHIRPAPSSLHPKLWLSGEERKYLSVSHRGNRQPPAGLEKPVWII